MARTVLVTGGGRGIGLGVVRQFLDEGCNVTVLEKNLDAADPSFADLVASTPQLWAMAGDLNNPDDREAFLQGTIERFGRLDILINNAGVAPRVRRDLLEVDEQSWDFVLDTNLKANFFLTQRVAQLMMAQRPVDGARGFIINYGSLNSYVVATDRVEYCASKAGIAMLTQVFARRLAPEQIYVYEVRPGVIEAARAAGASRSRILFRLVPREALGPLILGYTFVVVALVDMTAIAGVVAAGGLGEFAINYGSKQFNPWVTWSAVLVIVVIVQLVQFLGNGLARRVLRR